MAVVGLVIVATHGFFSKVKTIVQYSYRPFIKSVLIYTIFRIRVKIFELAAT